MLFINKVCLGYLSSLFSVFLLEIRDFSTIYQERKQGYFLALINII